MGAPNLLQQLYLKTALNESKDGMFDHPADLEEGNHMRAVRLARAGRYDAAALASNKAEASEMRRGGASKRSIKARFNKKDYAVVQRRISGLRRRQQRSARLHSRQRALPRLLMRAITRRLSGSFVQEIGNALPQWETGTRQVH